MSKKLASLYKKVFNERNTFFLLASILLFSYQLLYWNKSYPITEGWGINYANLVLSGKFPYRDFYYYLPPLNLLIDCLFWKLSFGYLIIYRFFRIVERFVILFLLYKVLLKITKPYYACIASFAGIIISTATVFDLCGDYNQSCDLITVVLCNILLSYCTHFSNNNSKKEFQYLFGLGIVLGCAFLLKQTIFVSSLIIIFIMLTLLYIIQKHPHYVKSILITLTGFLIPVIICFAILIFHNALMPFLDQVFFSADSKGSLWSVLTSILRITVNFKTIYLAIILLYCFYNIHKNDSLRIWFFILIAIGSIYIVFESDFNTLQPLIYTNKGRLLCVVLCALFTFSTLSDHYFYKKTILSYVPTALFIASILLIDFYFAYNTNLSVRIYSETNLFSMTNNLSKVCCAISFILTVYQFKTYYTTRNPICLKWIFLLSCGLISMYHLAMGASDNFNPRALIICVPVLICYIFESITHHFFMKNFIMLTSLTMICAGIISQKIACTYSWWGVTSTVIDQNHNCVPDIKAMRGIQLSADEANMYNEIFHILKDNTSANSSVYSFPQTQIFNVLLGNTNEAGFVPVPFYDTCADKYAINDAKTLAKNPPEILIWCDIPNCMETHEKIFRDGKPLGQRYIQRLFRTFVMQDKYTLIGQYNNIFIYKLNDGTDINYTYIQDATRENQTLMQN